MDIRRVKDAASGDWEDLLIQYGGLDAETLDGKHHPCPKCGGRDRFRYFADGTGGAICNQCFNSSNADGIATLAWIRGESTSDVLKLLADHYGLQNGKHNKQGGKKAPKNFGLTFREWSDDLAAIFCSKHMPIVPESLKAFGARMASHQGLPVIALPIYGAMLAPSSIVGWVLFHATGGKLPAGRKGNDLVAKKTAPGSKSGYLGPVEQLKSKETIHVWKCEGITDALSLHPLLPDGHVAITNASGCKEKPKQWMCRAVREKIVYVVHDCDVPGQEGATYVRQSDGSERPGWAPSLAIHAREVRNVVLPFPMQPDHGKDLRDWLLGGAGFVDLTELASKSKIIKPPADGEKALSRVPSNEIFKSEDDPHVLANAVLSEIEKDGKKVVRWNGEWWIWDGRCYRCHDQEFIESTISRVVTTEFERHWLERAAKEEGSRPCRKVTTGVIRNVASAMISRTYLDGKIPMGAWVDFETGEATKRNILAVENGLVDIDKAIEVLKEKQLEISSDDMKSCLMPHSPSWFSPVVLPYPWKYQKCDTWCRVVYENLGESEDAFRLFKQWCGYNLIHSTSMQKFLILEGDGGNGKSVLLAGLEAILGSENVSAVSLEGLGAKFEKILTLGKLANINHDAGEIDRNAIDKLKSFTSGDRVIFDRKNRDPIVAVPTARLTIACNNLPNWGDKSDGIWRRILLLECNRKISPDKRIPDLDKPHWWLESGELPGMLLFAVYGLYDLLVTCDGRFAVTDAMRERIEEYRAEINTARAYLRDEVEAAEHCEIECTELYGRYSAWCRERGHHPQAIQSFGREVKRLFGIDRKRSRNSGNRSYVYKGVGFKNDEIF